MDDNNLEGDINISVVEGDNRLFDLLYYEDICLLVVHSPEYSERDAIKVKLSRHNEYNKRPKL